MDARRIGPIAGTVAMCATIWFNVSTSTFAQYGPPQFAPAQVGAVPYGPLQYGPTHYGPAPIVQGYGQPVPQGFMSGPLGGQVRPMIGRLGSLAAAEGNPHDPASMVPRLPMQGVSPTAPASRNVADPSGVGQSENFIVLCHDQQLAARVSSEAERLRRDLAIHWLGEELPPWSRRCPIQVKSGPKLGAGGETRFALYNGNVGDWQMSVQGTPERILDSVLPHEITHTILASHFAPLNVHVPRWADEGACTTVEHDSEQGKHKKMLVDFMRTGRAMPFNRMFTLKDYPDDILPLYAQGHSVVEFLIAQSGPREFVGFLHQGMHSGSWEKAVRDHFGYETLGKLQIQWNAWIAAGRGEVGQFAGRSAGSGNVALVSGTAPSRSQPNRASVAQVPEGASVALPAFTTISSQTVVPGELNLTASNARSNGSPSTAQPDSDSFFRQRLESNTRSIQSQPASAPPTAYDAALRSSGSVLR